MVGYPEPHFLPTEGRRRYKSGVHDLRPLAGCNYCRAHSVNDGARRRWHAEGIPVEIPILTQTEKRARGETRPQAVLWTDHATRVLRRTRWPFFWAMRFSGKNRPPP